MCHMWWWEIWDIHTRWHAVCPHNANCPEKKVKSNLYGTNRDDKLLPKIHPHHRAVPSQHPKWQGCYMRNYGQDRLNFAFGKNCHMCRFLCPEHLIVRDSKDESEIFEKVPLAICTTAVRLRPPQHLFWQYCVNLWFATFVSGLRDEWHWVQKSADRLSWLSWLCYLCYRAQECSLGLQWLTPP